MHQQMYSNKHTCRDIVLCACYIYIYEIGSMEDFNYLQISTETLKIKVVSANLSAVQPDKDATKRTNNNVTLTVSS